VSTEANGIARGAKGSTEFEVLDGRKVLNVFRDYLDGVAPPVRSLDLPVQASGRIASGVSSRFDPASQIESWVFSMSARDVAKLFRTTGVKLFARNIRGFLGGTGINQAMEATLSDRPEYFWYFNNGITIVCSGAQEIRQKGRTVLRVNNPQVINGQQTTRVLAAQAELAPTASVLARVIQIPGDGHGEDRFDELISRIVEATNWQNQIKASDLVANDRRQVFIERELRKRGYQYLRKRQTSAEARAAAGSRFRFLIRKEELAQAVAACLFDPYVVRQGKEGLFAEQYYTTVFDGTSASYYLDRYWLMRRVSAASVGYPERAYAKWVVLHFMWSKVGRDIASSSESFRAACEQPRLNERVLRPLNTAIDIAFRECLAFYRQNRGSGPRAVDVSAFFNRGNRHKEFGKFWEQSGSQARRKRFDSALVRLVNSSTHRERRAQAASWAEACQQRSSDSVARRGTRAGEAHCLRGWGCYPAGARWVRQSGSAVAHSKSAPGRLTGGRRSSPLLMRAHRASDEQGRPRWQDGEWIRDLRSNKVLTLTASVPTTLNSNPGAHAARPARRAQMLGAPSPTQTASLRIGCLLVDAVCADVRVSSAA
jgi:hypothetical protein